MSQQFANNASAVLAASISAADTTITVSEQKNIPTLEAGDYFLATLFLNSDTDHIEIIKVTAVSGSAWTIERAQEGTAPLVHNINSPIELRLTKGTLENIVNLINSIDLSVLIDDGEISLQKTLSSSKIQKEIQEKTSTAYLMSFGGQ
ncbi:hypothetical protein [Marinomonas atlantica]|uniref:hypothetical protein n=1 Tax=Marinomonas atlantica TaxID=1806668 RepID=UPI000836FE75|nr:hypothetical protein [Marinomonas atlantica]